MRLVEESIVIRRPIDEVFGFVADATNDPTWHTTVVEGRRASAEPIGLGTTFDVIYDSHKDTLATPAQPAHFEHLRAVIIEYVPDQAVRFRVDFTDPPRGLSARMLGRSFELTFRFAQVAEGTRVYRGGEFHPVLFLRPLAPLFERGIATRNRYLLDNLKRAVEDRTSAHVQDEEESGGG